MTTEQALFAAILAHPHEDTPRLALADYLDERGGAANTERAAFIRHAVASDRAFEARQDLDEPHAVWSARAERQELAEMEKRARPAWTKVLAGRKGPLRGRNCWFHFSRGFPEVVYAPADRLVAEGDVLFRLAPILRVTAKALSAAALAPLLARPWVGRLAYLNTNGRYASGPPADWAELARTPHLAALDECWIDGGSLTPAGAAEVAAANPFPRLRKFQMSGVPMAAAAPALFGGPAFGAIEEVYFSGCGVTTAGVAAVLNAPGLAGLRRLSLPSSPLPRAGVEALVAGRWWATLTELVLYSTGQSDATVGVLAAAPPAAIGKLDLSLNAIGPRGAAQLAGSPLMAGLRSLELDRNPIGDAGAAALAASPHAANLRTLKLSSCGIGPDGAKALAAAPALAGLKTLTLSSNAVLGDGALAIAESPHLAGLEFLSLANVRGKARKKLVERYGHRVRL